MEILIKKRALLSALAGAKAARPNEFICLLTGQKEGDNVVISDTLIPPGIMVHPTMSSFSDWMLPYISDLLGTFHSHPGKDKQSPEVSARMSMPSQQDRWLFSKKGGIHMIAASPFGVNNVNAFLGTGQKVSFRVID